MNQPESLDSLMEEHQRLEHLLEQLSARRALTPAEQREIAELKKQKLRTKDRIARLSGGA
ncbi:MAG: YdcH family protein [Kofleriaceae bacterium]